MNLQQGSFFKRKKNLAVSKRKHLLLKCLKSKRKHLLLNVSGYNRKHLLLKCLKAGTLLIYI